MPGGSARRTSQNRFRACIAQPRSSRAFPSGVPAAHMSVTPTNFPGKLIPWGVPTTKCAPTQLLLCTAQGTRKRQPQCAGLISNITGSSVRHYGCYGSAVRPLGGAARAGHITDHPRKVRFRARPRDARARLHPHATCGICGKQMWHHGPQKNLLGPHMGPQPRFHADAVLRLA